MQIKKSHFNNIEKFEANKLRSEKHSKGSRGFCQSKTLKLLRVLGRSGFSDDFIIFFLKFN